MLYEYNTDLYRKNADDTKTVVSVAVKYDSDAQTFSAQNITAGTRIDVPTKIKKDYNGTRQELPFVDALLIGQFNIWLSGQVFETESMVEGWTKDELREVIKNLPEDNKDQIKLKGKCEFLIDDKGGMKKVFSALGLTAK